MNTGTDCRDCQSCANDPDGLYCAHAESFKAAPIYGRSINSARRKDEFCGPEAKFFVRADDKMLKARGRGQK